MNQNSQSLQSFKSIPKIKKRFNPEKYPQQLENYRSLMKEKGENSEYKEYSPLIAQILASRNISDSQELNYKTWEQLIPIDFMEDVTMAANHILSAIEKQQRILIVGDYDCDGATSTSLLLLGLRKCGAIVSHQVPNRHEHGYGLTAILLEEVIFKLPQKPDWIITVDNGISQRIAIDLAVKNGISVIVTDHHGLPHSPESNACFSLATAVINPQKQVFSNENKLHIQQLKTLAGVGVAFYLLLALFKLIKNKNSINNIKYSDLLGLVAIGTIADLVPFSNLNRLLISKGLEQIRLGNCSIGLQKLITTPHLFTTGKLKAGIDLERLTIQDVGFNIAPSINAAGRLDDMNTGILCLTTEDSDLASQYVSELRNLNNERKTIQEDIKIQAMELAHQQLSANPNLKTLVLYHEDWEHGVIGIVASHVKEYFHRPTFLFGKDHKNPMQLRASGRSITGVHLLHTLIQMQSDYPHVLQHFGGHSMAAGLSLKEELLQDFHDALETVIAQSIEKQDIEAGVFDAEILIDGHLTPTTNIEDLLNFIEKQLWGMKMPEPIFYNEFKLINIIPMVEGKYARLEGVLIAENQDSSINNLSNNLSNNSTIFQLLSFNYRADFFEKNKIYQIIFQPQWNEFRGIKTVQLRVETVLN